MNTTQCTWTREQGWRGEFPANAAHPAQLVLVFGATEILRNTALMVQARAAFPRALWVGTSTAGEISGTRVSDDSLVLTAVTFAHTSIHGAWVALTDAGTSFEAGRRLGTALPKTSPVNGAPIAHVFLASDGLHVNGSELVRGLTEQLSAHVTVTGGLAGDGARFGETLVWFDDRAASSRVAAIGFYGDRLKVGCGSLGGWDSFGPERLITRAKGNVLYELDGHSALGLYKKYLGEQASGLPATGLLYPLSLRTKAGETPVVRTILAVDEHDQSMTFAGDLPEGAYARLMRANFDRLIDGAVGAAKTGLTALGDASPQLAILISCVGRKLVLKQRIEEEVEGVRDVLGKSAALTGFYSYGEISPFTPGARCELHNQTMTITTLSES